MTQRPLIAYFGHHKCASTFVNNVVTHLGIALGLKSYTEWLSQELPFGYHEKEPHKSRLAEIKEKVAALDYDILIHANADNSILDILSQKDYRGFHVIRDPRDLLVSGYFSHKQSHPVDENYNPWMGEDRDRLQSVGQDEGLLMELDYWAPYFKHLGEWNYENPNIYETRFEVLTSNPVEEFQKIFSFVGIKIGEGDFTVTSKALINYVSRRIIGPVFKMYQCPSWVYRRIVEQYSFKQLTKGRTKGEEDTESHFRKGISGDWQNYFTPHLKEAFKNRYGDLVVKLGYEQSNDW